MTSDDCAEKAERYREISVNTLAHNERLMEENERLRDLVREMLPPLLEGDCLWCVHHWSNRGDCTGDGECELEERAKGLMI